MHLLDLKSVLIFALLIQTASAADEPQRKRHPDERDGAATIIHRADVVRDRATNNNAPMRLWPLYSTAEARMNYVEVAGRSAMHFHPDADHKLYVLEGRVAGTPRPNKNFLHVRELTLIPEGAGPLSELAAKGERAVPLEFRMPPFSPRDD